MHNGRIIAHINLLEDLGHEKSRLSSHVMLWASAALALTLAVYYIKGTHTLAEQRRVLEAATHELEVLQRKGARPAANPTATAEQEESAEHEVANLEDLAYKLGRSALSGNESFTAPIRALALLEVDGVRLTGVALNKQNRPLSIEGYALDAARIAAYIAALQKQAPLSGTTFTALEIKALATQDAAHNPTAATEAVSFRLTSTEPRALGATARSHVNQRQAP
jgi:Tfp pilus assembly protein PilN